VIQSHQTYPGASYVVTVALLVCGFVFSPALLLLYGPSPAGAVAAIGMSALFLAAARISWRRFSNLTISSVVR